MIQFHCIFSISYKHYHILFIIIVFRLGGDKLVSCFFYTVFSKVSVTRCDSSHGGGIMIFHFRLFKSILFLFIEIHYAFSISYNVLTCNVYYYCIWYGFITLFSCFFRRIFTVLSQGISHGMWLLAWEFLLFSSVLPFTYASSFRLLLLQLCNNRCAEALVVKQKFSVGG